MDTKNVHQTVSIKARVSTVFNLLMDSKQHSKISGSKAVIGQKPGSKFSVWNGGINGITLHVSPNKTIVQAWRTEEWPEGHYSIATFHFEKEVNGTKLIFDQYGVPGDDYGNISRGWKEFYWDPMKRILEKQ